MCALAANIASAGPFDGGVESSVVRLPCRGRPYIGAGRLSPARCTESGVSFERRRRAPGLLGSKERRAETASGYEASTILPDDEYLESTLEVTISRDMRSLIGTASQQQALLIVLSGARIGTRSVLAESAVDIGRGSACQLILDADSVSRRHARIEWNGQQHRLVDLGSTNGTFVNGSRVKEALLRDGDRIGIGKALLKYLAGGNIEGAYHEEIQRLMRFDALTGVFNKRHFEESLRLAVFTTRTSPKPVSLIVFDLDHFKRINDKHGHMAGDHVLCEMAKVVKDTLYPDQVFGRVGGEEFAVLWEGTGLRAAIDHAERIRTRIAGHRFNFEGSNLPVTVSLGVAERPVGLEEEPERLYERADEKLYQAKAGGRNRVVG